jgi:hypothetical protein
MYRLQGRGRLARGGALFPTKRARCPLSFEAAHGDSF